VNGRKKDLMSSYHDKALGRLHKLPKYDVQCQDCKNIHVKQMSFEEYDNSVKGFNELCLRCDQTTKHKIILLTPPPVEYRTDGFTKNDWADVHTKYQRDHFQESGTRTEEKAHNRKRRKR
jgi:hypothetical protein